MKKLKLAVDELEVVSFRVEDADDVRGTVDANLITGPNNCTTRYPTIVGSCCTPIL